MIADTGRPVTRNLTVEVLTSARELQALRDEWTALLHASESNRVFLTWEWTSTWWTHFSHRQRLFILAARDGDGRLVGLAPLKITRRTYRSLAFEQLEFIGYGPEVAPDYLDIIVAPQYRDDVLQVFARAIADAPAMWDVMLLADMLTESPTLAWVRQFARDHRYRHAEREAYRCPYLTLPGTWDAYVESLTANMRAHVRRRVKTLERTHGGRLILVRDASNVRAGMEALFRLHAERWKLREVVGTFDRHAESKTFHADVAELFMQKDWLRLYLLEAGDEIVAVLYGYEYDGRFAYFQAGFDPRWAKQSVGSVLMASIIRDCIERGVREFDFLRGDEAYKYRWSRSERTTRDALIWNNTMRGRLHLAQVRGVALVKRLLGVMMARSCPADAAHRDGAQ